MVSKGVFSVNFIFFVLNNETPKSHPSLLDFIVLTLLPGKFKPDGMKLGWLCICKSY